MLDAADVGRDDGLGLHRGQELFVMEVPVAEVPPEHQPGDHLAVDHVERAADVHVRARFDASGFRIVGPDEIDPARRYVSMDSPLARALMRRQSGDEFTVEVPGGTRSYEILSIRYI